MSRKPILRLKNFASGDGILTSGGTKDIRTLQISTLSLGTHPERLFENISSAKWNLNARFLDLGSFPKGN